MRTTRLPTVHGGGGIPSLGGGVSTGSDIMDPPSEQNDRQV